MDRGEYTSDRKRRFIALRALISELREIGDGDDLVCLADQNYNAGRKHGEHELEDECPWCLKRLVDNEHVRKCSTYAKEQT